MSTGPDPRFTEEETALILRRAVELESAGMPEETVSGGLTLSELRDVAREAGIAPQAIDLATQELGLHGASQGIKWLGPPLAQRATRTLRDDLRSEDTELLVRLLERRLNQAGQVSEAFGQTRWVSTRAQLTTEVALTVGKGKARIAVEQRYPSPMRSLLQLIPGALGAATVAAVAGPVGIAGAGVVALAAGGALAGVAVGRGLWHLVSRESKRNTGKIAGDLAAAATELGRDR